MKRKTLTLVISLFALVAIISVGFSAWIISRPAQNMDASGTIQVEAVDSSALTTMTVTQPSQTIKFGTPATMNNTDAWLKATEPTMTEELTATFEIKLSQALATGESIVLTFKAGTGTGADFVAEDAATGKFAGLVSNNYVKAPVISAGSQSSANPLTLTSESGWENDGTKGAKKITVSVKFGWGTKLGGSTGDNPYVYFNSAEQAPNYATIEQRTAALNELQHLATEIANVTYKVEVSYAGN